MIGKQTRKKVSDWIRDDFSKNPLRFVCEALGMGFNFAACIWMATTAPNPPMLQIYTLFLIATVFLFSCAVSRRSTFFSLMYIGFLIIDGVGFFNSLPLS